jgi:DNA repair protein RecN (Recombination protein N)
MLRSLNIRDMLLIDQLDLEFQPGLNVLTGETGAGKSILLDSLGFVLGWRGRAELVRSGAKQGEVVASFALGETHPVHGLLAEFGLPEIEDELLLRRTNSRDGRKVAYVNDRRCSGEALRALSATLVELHGQHDDKGLLNVSGHRALLDSFAGVDTAATRKAWKTLRAANKELETARVTLAEAEKDAEFLRHAVEELDQLAPEPGEEARLDAARRLMQGAARVREDITRAAHALGGEAAEGALLDATRWLEGAQSQLEGRLDAPLATLGRILSDLADTQQDIEDCLRALDFNPLDLEIAEERLFAIRGLARKHNVLPDELAGFADDLRRRLQVIDTGAEHLETLQAACDQALKTYEDAASRISAERSKAALALDKAMAAELAPLKMERAVFSTLVSKADPGPEGMDMVAFEVATNPGAPSGPINKIASGGELSRFLLALKVCLTRHADGLTLIFDEIDRGVGGATADAVGRRLSALADRSQVLVVTHSPQVAAQGAHQWQVSKSVENGQTRSSVVMLSDAERIREIARMLAGDVITPEAEAAARSLLER